jgi:diguanylate cyclase (GGDEF)-like protein
LAQSIQKTVLSLKLPHEGSPLGVVTVSIGYAAAVPDGVCTFEELLQAADDAMYEAKASGRNCVRGAGHLCTNP